MSGRNKKVKENNSKSLEEYKNACKEPIKIGYTADFNRKPLHQNKYIAPYELIIHYQDVTKLD